MKIEIWSDIVCPFCYIGKRKFENALAQFPHKDQVEVVWHSFQLDPELKHVPGKSMNEVLAEKKGWSLEQTRQMNRQVTAMAQEVGLNYNLDEAIPANTFNAHRLTHLAAQHNLQDQAEERLFIAFFTEGKNIGDPEVLLQIGTEIGLPEEEVRQMLQGDVYADVVQQDSYEAQQLGIRGVPFFVINRKYGVSGAQPSELFLQTLNKVWEEEKPALVSLNQTEGSDTSCTDGFCES
jgi:predicted DsbA family dithiol-disulfide isomerase